MNDVIMKVHKLVYSFGSRLLFNGLNLNIKSGNIVSVVGTNNSGKTTLIRILGAEYVTNDMISVNKTILSEKSLQAYKRNVSYLTFTSLKFSSDTVYDELLSVLDNMKWSDDKKKGIVQSILKNFSLQEYSLRHPSRLSRRVKINILIAKALITSPKVLILELSSNDLTFEEKDEIFNLLKKYVDKGMSIVYETNNIEDVLYSNRMIVLHKGNVAIEGDTMTVLKKDSLLLKLGLEIPFMVDLSLKLKFYDVIDRIYLNEDDLVKRLWK